MALNINITSKKAFKGYPEFVQSIILWINAQDVFRTYQLYDAFGLEGLVEKSERKRTVLRVLQFMRTEGYIQGLEPNQYVVERKTKIDRNGWIIAQ